MVASVHQRCCLRFILGFKFYVNQAFSSLWSYKLFKLAFLLPRFAVLLPTKHYVVPFGDMNVNLDIFSRT